LERYPVSDSSEKGYVVDRVCVERVFTLPVQFETFRIRLEAQVLPGQETGDVVRALDKEIVDIRNGPGN
jgi:hypothetical protein